MLGEKDQQQSLKSKKDSRQTPTCSSGKPHVGEEPSTGPHTGNCAFGRAAGKEVRSVWQPESEVLRTMKL